MKNTRRRYLINPGFQIRFLIYVALAVLISLTVLYVSNMLYFDGLVEQGEEIGLDPTHPYYELINEQRAVLDRTYMIVSAVVFVLLMWSGLVLSNHIAGPIYHVSAVLQQLTNDAGDATRVELRDGDFFKELEEIVNNMVDRYQQEVDRSNKRRLEYVQDVSAVKAVAGARLLVVEDNEINLELAVELLTSNGVEVETARNGQEALEQLETGLAIDGILMDGQMPIMDGFEATRAIRNMEQYREIPIIAMTASVMADDRQRIADAGMNTYVNKPINVSELFHTLADLVEPSEAIYSRDTGLERNVSDSLVTLGIPGVDTREGLFRTQQNVELYERLLKRFASEHRDFREVFRRTLETGGLKTAERLAHSLTGVAGNVGAVKVQRLARDLENLCEASASDTEIRHQADLVADTLEEVLGSIEKALSDAARETAATDSRAELEDLKAMVLSNDTAALATIERLLTRPEFTDSSELHALESAIRQYDFDLARKLVEELKPG